MFLELRFQRMEVWTHMATKGLEVQSTWKMHGCVNSVLQTLQRKVKRLIELFTAQSDTF